MFEFTSLTGTLQPVYTLDILLAVLIGYFLVSILYVSASHFITAKGSVYIFFITLTILLIFLILNLNLVVLNNAVLSSNWLLIPDFWNFPNISIAIRLDTLSFFFVLLVVLIGCFTNLYIINYFKGEGSVIKLFGLINLFVCGMLLLVLGGNFYTLFLGWELIGLTSFFLINFWQSRIGTVKSSYKAFAFNQASDACLLIFFVLIWDLSQESMLIDITLYFKLNTNYNVTTLKVATFFLVIGCGIKSAQFGCHIWLPDSMEAPVPASALIHSATLVSAGIYVLLRLQPIVEITISYTAISCWGALTAAYGGIVASAQTDVKKVLAYSTISHCGFLFVTLGFNNLIVTVVYLYMHGIFKALTFFIVGSFIKTANTQDMRGMGMLSRLLPLETLLLIVSVTNLGGFPFTLGFLFKKLFLVGLLLHTHTMFITGCCTIGLLTSLVYSYKLIYYTCFDTMNNKFFITINKIQLNKTIVTSNYEKWSSSSIAQFICFIGLYSFSVFFYIYMCKYFLNFGFGLTFFDTYSSLTYSDINFVETHFKSFYYHYYGLFLVTVACICLVEWRQSFTWGQKFHTYIYIFSMGILLHSMAWLDTKLILLVECSSQLITSL